MEQLEIVFVFNLKTYNKKEDATPYRAGLYNVNRLREVWNRDLTPDGKAIEKKMLSFLMNPMDTLS